MGFPFQSFTPACLRRVGLMTKPPLFRPVTYNSDIANLAGVGQPHTRPHPPRFNSFRPLPSRSLTTAFSRRVEYEASVMNITRKMRGIKANPVKELQIIDILQRTGIDHLFRNEISEALHRHYLEYHSMITHSPGDDECCSLDLHQASLRFRLLREEGYDLSSTGTFGDYIDGGGKFRRECLGNGIQGVLSLFEASQMGTEADKILDEAKTFSEQILCDSINSLDGSSSRLVYNTLKYPHHMTFARFKSNDFICDELQHVQGWRKEIADLAVMEFERARLIYKDEILHISKWWKELELTKDLKHARNEPLEWHMWSLGSLPDPSMAKERIEMSKPVSLIYIIDDIFDIYGKPEDLCLFTESVNRWDLATAEKLPDYMKRCLKALFDTTSHISHEIWVKHGFNPEHHLRKVWTDLFNAYLVESKWFASGYLPTTEEYMKMGTITCGVHVVLVHMMFLLGQGVDYENNGVRHYDNHIHTSIISSVATILRLWNDLGKAKVQAMDDDQHKIGHDGSYIECYMKENVGVSVKAAEEHIVGRISGVWKCLNGMCLRLPHSSSYSSTTFKKGCLNLARIVPLMYDYDNTLSKPVVEDLMYSLLNALYV